MVGAQSVDTDHEDVGAVRQHQAPLMDHSGEGEKKSRFKLAKLANPFGKKSEEESAEVTGAGAGRAVGEEGEETGGGPKNPALVEVSITPADLAAFRREGGLPG